LEPTRQHLTERRGVALVQMTVADQLRWLFREQTVSDLGVDAQIEALRDGKSSGCLIALQIKSGDSYFRGDTVEGIVYRDDRRHLEYWLSHSLPVVLVLCRPDTGEAYWQHINSETAVRTSFGCKVFVPRANRFDSSALDALARLAFPGASEPAREAEIPWTQHSSRPGGGDRECGGFGNNWWRYVRTEEAREGVAVQRDSRGRRVGVTQDCHTPSQRTLVVCYWTFPGQYTWRRRRSRTVRSWAARNGICRPRT
jgi:hypothetical protein